MKIIIVCPICRNIDLEFSDNGDYIVCNNCENSLFIEDSELDFTCEKSSNCQ